MRKRADVFNQTNCLELTTVVNLTFINKTEKNKQASASGSNSAAKSSICTAITNSFLMMLKIRIHQKKYIYNFFRPYLHIQSNI